MGRELIFEKKESLLEERSSWLELEEDCLFLSVRKRQELKTMQRLVGLVAKDLYGRLYWNFGLWRCWRVGEPRKAFGQEKSERNAETSPACLHFVPSASRSRLWFSKSSDLQLNLAARRSCKDCTSASNHKMGSSKVLSDCSGGWKMDRRIEATRWNCSNLSSCQKRRTARSTGWWSRQGALEGWCEQSEGWTRRSRHGLADSNRAPFYAEN